MKITNNFTLEELTRSPTASRLHIDNTPDKLVCSNLTFLCESILQPLRNAYGRPIVVSSGYRCKLLNQAIGGVKNSQHMFGQAADIRSLSDHPEDNKELFNLIKKLKLPFDQLIDEYGYNWIHVSFGPRNRRQVLHIGH